ncbi:hypothetical protein G6F57_010172 [Rhizopus arrhizus]|uniref:Restriction endonuclease type IV Mrr domain-containing protein n=1 Tax=Rhizopus oryzae TaxID=64495 RepID=A0A9P6X1X6_RHIOR|nr:hypothetical protein G6F23_006243 [Rhizopus arrhizus]KAG0757744.1 hypothetical protein G6F24_010279 [Rhizopus arrhizus]KAG0783815.1 hypothetical protein G6F21_010301 [Rhizopus arrhizus]KAG0812351.1 hypothetical protein G6F20_006436 [Rhizopus arrhizus]KAG0823677.1 hypothetical protein G6F19_010730 [Rhizopus arrhizus]
MLCFQRLYSTTPLRLDVFLKQAKETTSNHYRGTLFELQTLHALESTAKMQLVHVGGKSDGGVDLRGQWLCHHVIVQCKNVKEGCSPEHLRGLMGTASLFGTRKKMISILATRGSGTYTPDVLSHFNTSPLPLGLAGVNDITLTSLMFNKAAQSLLKNRVNISTVFDTLGNESLHIDLLE